MHRTGGGTPPPALCPGDYWPWTAGADVGETLARSGDPPQPIGPAAWPPAHASAWAIASRASARATNRGSAVIGVWGLWGAAATSTAPEPALAPQPIGPLASRSPHV